MQNKNREQQLTETMSMMVAICCASAQSNRTSPAAKNRNGREETQLLPLS